MTRKSILSSYYQIYCDRIGRNELSEEEFLPLVMNLAYLEIAKAKISNTAYDTEEIFVGYTFAGIEVIPGFQIAVDDPRYYNMYPGFIATAEWDGLWNFLREYFANKIGVEIDNNNRKQLRFDSSVHERYENDILISRSQVNRKIVINLSEDMTTGQFSISESLSPKEGYLLQKQENNYIFIGNDPDFRFTFHLDNFGNLIEFMLERTDRNLKIIYIE